MDMEPYKKINIIEIDFKDKNKNLVQILVKEYERKYPLKIGGEEEAIIYFKLKDLWIKRQYYLRYGKNVREET